MQPLKTRVTVGRSMVGVAALALLLGAWIYRRDHENIERSLTGLQLREYSEGDADRRRVAVENLSDIQAKDLPRVVAALTSALRDDDWRVRRSAAKSVGLAIRGCVQAREGAVEEEVDLATRALIRALDDPRAEVRAEAIRALESLQETIQIGPMSKAGVVTKGAIGPKDDRAVAPLAKAIHDPDPAVRALALRAYARFAPARDRGPQPVLDVVGTDPDPVVRAAAIDALVTGWPKTNPTHHMLLLLRLEDILCSPEERSTIAWNP